ncbi:MAG: hypothetical protein Q8M83_06415 [bacterium]|nr:hypothetical protein [bacterium]
MKWTRGQMVIFVVAAVFWLFVGAFALRQALAQQGPLTCSTDANCPTDQYCIAGKCNLPAPIWNTKLLQGDLAQQARINLGGGVADWRLRTDNLQFGFGNQINNIAGGEVAVNYTSVGSVGKGFSIYDGTANPWFRVDNQGDVTVSNNLKVYGCFGPVYQQPSETSSNGNAGGYMGVNAKCPAQMHVCTTSEILQSVNCGEIFKPGKDTNGGQPMWISNLAPSLPTPTNDCGGWKTSTASSVGVVYSFNSTGGAGGTAACNSSLKFSCCK